ncbi:hypothetical protein D9757_005424 [Collybiopsis confluens]|uniref:Uncharacterized protein n=1 Tax=Collybiopsis confluens TaxID=2823264 RepID=A0A8H5HM10_9AGAR|nr:hypothetical protein D9757_005424 [Collybiopsis confluens]
MTKLFSPSKDKSKSSDGVMDALPGTQESWTDSDYCHITAEDLPIALDDPAVITPASSSLTLNLAVRTPGTERTLLTHLKNISRISVSVKKTPSIRLKAVRDRIRLPFVGRRSGTHSILDEFPKPPSYIPTPVTPITPAAYRWPPVAGPPIEWEHDRDREKSRPFKSLTRVFTRRGRRSSFRDLNVPKAEETIIVRPPRPTRPAPSPLLENSYQVVDPIKLTASPTPLLEPGYPVSARTSFAPPSPSWLSRNVQPGEEIPETPSSPPPLPIPPRIMISDCSDDTPLLSPLEATAGWLEYPEETGMRQSFVSMINAPKREGEPEYKPEGLLLQPSSPLLSVPTPTAGIPSALATPSSPASLYLQYQSASAQVSDSPDSKNTLVSDSPRFFVPSLRPTDPDLPRGFSTLLSTLFIEAGLSLASNHNKRMNGFGIKRNDVVDFGGEADYENMEWFKEAPPSHLRPQPPSAEPVGTPYVPDRAVIEQNEAFEFALGAAPNVLYARFKQYGQLGVLAWCAEFGELIDNLKELGFAGNMFVSTRTQALRCCSDILQLRLDIGMQIILMYLSSQVARLRRFLDGERVWDDYPEPEFPIDPNAYAAK